MIRIFLTLIVVSCYTHSDISVKDYMNRDVVLQQPAKRIVGLAPHIIENLYSAGAGQSVVGAVDYCDFPEAAKKLPRVGAISAFSLEAIVNLKPDLVIVWRSGRGGQILEKLENLGLTVYASDPRALDDVPRSIIDFGKLAGTENIANQAASLFRQRHSQLKQKFAQSASISTLYQVWNDPIQTLNDNHIISDVIRLCGGRNAFGDAVALAPKISVESVIQRNPDVIIASGMGEKRPEWLDEWRKWGALKAVQHENLYFIEPDIIQRHTARILDGAEKMCEHLQATRTKAEIH